MRIASLSVAAVASMALFSAVRAAADCGTSFSTQASLAALEQLGGGSSVAPPYYDETCSGSIHLHFAPINYMHFHLNPNDPCVGPHYPPPTCAGYNQKNTNCGGTTAVCTTIDITAQPRHLTQHVYDAKVTLTVLPSPGQYCIPNGGTGQACVNLSGHWVAPRFFRGSPLSLDGDNAPTRIWGQRWDRIAVGTPSGTRYTLAGVTALVKDDLQPGVYTTMTPSVIYDHLWTALKSMSDTSKRVGIANMGVAYQ